MEVSHQLDQFSCDLEESLLLRRLKALGKSWSRAPIEINTSTSEWKYNDLAAHLASSAFISHTSFGVKLLTAFNLAQVFRIRQCKHPYDNDQLHNILKFLISQLQRVVHKMVDVHKYQEKILEILLLKDVIQVLWNSNKLQQLSVHIYETLLSSAHSDLSLTTKERMIQLAGKLVEHLPNVPREIIKLIFMNCQNKIKESNKAAYDVTVKFIRKYKDTLGPAIGNAMFEAIMEKFENNWSGENESTSTLELLKFWMSRIWHLHAICNDIIIPILRNLETTLYSMSYRCRYVMILFLGKIFAKPSTVPLHEVCSSLWKSFLGRFQDKNLQIRLTCLDLVPDLFKNEDLRCDLISTFRKRKMDRNSKVRYKLASLVFILHKNFGCLSPEIISDLSMILEELALDPKVKVQFSSLGQMAELYDFFTENEREYLPVLKIVEKYPNCILKHFWFYGKEFNEERLTVIQLMNKYLVPYSMPPGQRMKRLMKVLAILDSFCSNTLAQIKYQQHIISHHLCNAIKFIKKSKTGDSTGKKEAILNAMAISHHIPLPLDAALTSVISFADYLSEENVEAESINNVLAHKSHEEIDQILESLKANRKYSNEFTWIFELSSDWLFDEQSHKIFISYFDDFIRGERHLLEELNLGEFPMENGFKMIVASSKTSLPHLQGHDTVYKFISWFRISRDRFTKLHVLKSLSALHSEDNELLVKYPEVMDELLLIFQDSCSQSDTGIARWSIRSLLVAEPKREELSQYLLSTVLDLVKDMTSSDLNRAYCSIYYLGYILLYMDTYFKDVIPDVLSNQVLNKVMFREDSSNDSSTSGTFPPINIKIKARYLKFLAQYSSVGGLFYDDVLDLLFEVIEKGGRLRASSSLSFDEEAWMRLSAGRSVLRFLRGGSIDMLTRHQFYLLSGLMNDVVPKVREIFFEKFKGSMMRDYPSTAMPPELLSLCILTNFEDSDFELGEESKTVVLMRYLFSMKLKFVKFHMKTEAFSDVPAVNEVLVYGLLALSHSQIFTNGNNLEQLHKVKAKLKGFFDFLMTDENINFSFYKNQVEMMKKHKLRGENEDSNKKLWTLCDIALFLMKKRSIRTSKVTKDPTLPKEFFESKAIKSTRSYLTKRAIAVLFPKKDESNLRAREEEDDEEEASEYELGDTEDEMSNLVVMVGEGNMDTEDESHLDDEVSSHTEDGTTIFQERYHTRSSVRKRKISEV